MPTPATPPPAAAGGDAGPATPAVPGGRPVSRIAWASILLLAVAIALCVLAYLAATVPGRWFPAASAKAWTAANLTLNRGTGRIVGDELLVLAPDATGTVLVTVTSELRSTDYPAVAWIGADFPERAKVGLLWRSDYAPGKVNSAPVDVESGRLRPVLLQDNPAWVGRISGLALIVQGELPQPVRIRGVVAKPMGAPEVLRDRAGEWLAFEGWTGSSINTIAGGADVQDLPLPLLLACAVALAGAAVWALRRWGPRPPLLPLATGLLALFLVAWTILDLRWTWNLVRQVEATAADYAGKSSQERHRAAEDGPLFAFVEKARAIMPASPARVFVVAETPYFRRRAAYHLYPHNVFADPRRDSIPAADWLRPGDWILVYQRRGIQFDAAQGRLRWDDTETVPAEAKLIEPGAALFVVR
jgi:hypothetical protein